MKIYLDYIFFENLIINIILTLQIAIFTKTKLKIGNVACGSVFLATYSTIAYSLKDGMISSIYIKIIISLIYVYIGFFPKTISEYIKKVGYYYLIYFLFVGIIISISLMFKIQLSKIYTKILIYVISGLILYLSNKYLWKVWKTNIKNNDLTYTINIEGQEIECFVDTGNTVKDLITNLDVIFIDEKYKDPILSLVDVHKVEIEYFTICESKKVESYIIKNVGVYKNKKLVAKIDKIIITFVKEALKNKKYSALIGYDTYIENLKGVTL